MRKIKHMLTSSSSLRVSSIHHRYRCFDGRRGTFSPSSSSYTSSKAFNASSSSSSSLPNDVLENARTIQTTGKPLKHRPPNFDFTALVASIASIRSRLPLKVTNCMQLDPHTLTMHFINEEREKLVVQCSSHPDFARVALVPRGEATSRTTQTMQTKKRDRLSFGVLANEILRDKVLVEAFVPVKFERVCVFRFAERAVAGESEYEVVCEVTGRKSNVIIVDSKTRNVVAASHQVGEKQSQVRSVVLGKPYAFPPPPPGKDPMEIGDCEAFRKAILNDEDGEDDDKNFGSLSKAFQGVSPALERTLRAIAAANATVGANETKTSEYYEALFDAFARWRASVDRALEAVEDEDERAKNVKAYFSEHTRQILLHETENAVMVKDDDENENENEDETRRTSLGAIFTEMYEEKSNENEYESERNDCLKAVKTALQKSANKKAAFEKQIKAGEKHDEMSLEADAIMAYASQYKKNDDFVNGFDFETGEPKTFKVDKDLGAIGTAEALYKKARKLRRTADAVFPLMEELEKEREYLEQVEFNLRELSLGAVDDEETSSSSSSSSSLEDKIVLEEIKIELVRANLMKPRDKQSANEVKAMKAKKKNNNNGSNKNSNSKQSRKEQLMSGVRQYVAPSGKIVLCGRNSRGNEAVSLHLSQPQDVWFHVRGAPGSHVVLRQQPGAIASDEDMQFAADLAAFHSKVRNDGKVQVSYTSPKNVRKPSGVSRLGMVTITKEEVMIGRPDDSVSFKNGETGRARGDVTEDGFD